jgi:hypothetical protein
MRIVALLFVLVCTRAAADPPRISVCPRDPRVTLDALRGLELSVSEANTDIEVLAALREGTDLVRCLTLHPRPGAPCDHVEAAAGAFYAAAVARLRIVCEP